jgi:PAS domain S-box-containing protein
MEKKSILIVEDEQISALDLRETLLSLGYRVTGMAASGEKAIEMVDAEEPDLILMDIRLAGVLSGIEAAEKILTTHRIPIIYLTAYADPELVERAKKTRPYGYIIKPYDQRGIQTDIEIALYKFELDQNLSREYANLEQRVHERTEDLARANETLRRLSTDHKMIFDNAPAMIWYKDTSNTFVRINPAGARAFGLSIEQIEGRSAAELFPEMAEKYHQDDLVVIRSGNPSLGIIEQISTARGDTLWVQTDKIPIKDEAGQVTGILAFVVDVTERKIAQDALALANKKLGLMSSITRHDILNQIMAMNAYLELSRELATDPEVSEYLEKMVKISASIEHHISFTRDYQTIGVNAPVWQDVGACIFRSAAALPMRKVRVTTDLHDVKVLADPLFEKIFYNLIDNALKYGGDNLKRIHITSEETGAGLTLIVEDDGAGISSEDRPHLFSKGFGKHTGLGLFLTREILGITGMEIQEIGTAGKGARFEITVPKGAFRISR